VLGDSRLGSGGGGGVVLQDISVDRGLAVVVELTNAVGALRRRSP
jgi:hypothetical protein